MVLSFYFFFFFLSLLQKCIVYLCVGTSLLWKIQTYTKQKLNYTEREREKHPIQTEKVVGSGILKHNDIK